MKFLVIQCDETVDVTPFTIDKSVTVSDGTNTVDGKVMASIHMAEPPTLEGDFHITPL